MKARRKLLSATAASALALTGCLTTEDTVRFGKYTMSGQTYNQIVRDVSEFDRAPIDFEEFLHLCGNFDENKNSYISPKEGIRGMEGIMATARAGQH